MATTFSDLKTRLNTWLRDTADLTFTDTEKTEILKEAINDPYVFSVTRDTSLTTASGTYAYALPTGIEVVFDLYIDSDGTGRGDHIDRADYDVVDGYIRTTSTSWPTSKTLIVVGKNKLTTSTSDFPTKVQEYILHMAMVSAFEMLKTSLTTRFVKNDMNMGDLVNSIATHKARAAELRTSIMNQRLVTL